MPGHGAIHDRHTVVGHSACGAYPKMREALDTLPPKMLKLRSGELTKPVDPVAQHLEGRVDRIVARIQAATFTNNGDILVGQPAKKLLFRMYATHGSRIGK